MKLSLLLGALAAAALVLHLNRSASVPANSSDRSTQIERTPSSGDMGRDGNAGDAGNGEAMGSKVPANEQREERIVPPVRRVAPKAPEPVQSSN